MKNKKLVFSYFNIYENDSLRDYLEDMALKGWELTSLNNFFLHFRACDPHPVRYCVEVMKGSCPYASNQTRPLKQYREFCQEAGWDYRGTNGYLHVFSTDDLNAIPVETDSCERYRNIRKAAVSSCLAMGLLFMVLCLLNLFTCYEKRTLLCSQGAVVFVLLVSSGWFITDFLIWNQKARRSLSETGALPCPPWKSVLSKNRMAFSFALLFCGAVFLAAVSEAPSGAGVFLLPYFITYGIMLFVFSRLIRLLREKTAFSKTANILIYWGAALVAVILVTGIFCAAIFSHFLR